MQFANLCRSRPSVSNSCPKFRRVAARVLVTTQLGSQAVARRVTASVGGGAQPERPAKTDCCRYTLADCGWLSAATWNLTFGDCGTHLRDSATRSGQRLPTGGDRSRSTQSGCTSNLGCVPGSSRSTPNPAACLLRSHSICNCHWVPGSSNRSVTAQTSQRPGTPLSSCAPRPTKQKLEPTRMS